MTPVDRYFALTTQNKTLQEAQGTLEFVREILTALKKFVIQDFFCKKKKKIARFELVVLCFLNVTRSLATTPQQRTWWDLGPHH